ncbi:MAG: FAD-binding protein [Marinilabiliales bacterium]|nr:MAG: FAD-binding protein [Marinilabiliales bacterium]
MQLVLNPFDATDNQKIKKIAASKLRIDFDRLVGFQILRKSVDARNRNVKINMKLRVFTDEHTAPVNHPAFNIRDVQKSREVYIVGSGPAGLFAALHLIELGLKPIVLERGKSVSNRKKDIALISTQHKVDEDSNYCFGEGGAGAFSDGKLYTRSKKRGENKLILNILNQFGAVDNILYEAHPHIGTDKLPEIIKSIREAIIQAGGQVLFNQKLTGIKVENGKLYSVFINETELKTDTLILAAGHSARDVYQMLEANKLELQPKGFAMGVRVEHPRELIDEIQYHGSKYLEVLPAAEYNFAMQQSGRGVYSFCMCPGGFIVPASTSASELVVNGMSPASRNSPYSNSGVVVEIRPDDCLQEGFSSGLEFQRFLEEQAWVNANKTQQAPAQRIIDFVHKRPSKVLPKASYFPGVVSSDIHRWMPDFISKRLQKSFLMLDRRMKGFLSEEAIIVGVESRTSSPVRIPRNKDTWEHEQCKGLFPCGEGAGYAGGIVSSAIDGWLAAEKVQEML